MNRSCLIEKVKANKYFYALYYYIGSLIINTIRLFIRTDNKMILFVSFGGRHFNDSPQVIYKAMKNDKRFSGYKLVWAFRKPEDFDIPKREKIKIDTVKYYITALKARCWITNVMVERALNFRGKNTYYFHTTHGAFPKYIGRDVKDNSFDTRAHYHYDCSCAQSEYEAQIQRGMFELDKEHILLCGYPKNDRLSHYTLEECLQIRSNLNIPKDKKVILYAPTFRENAPNVTKVAVDFHYWEKELGDEYVVLFRAHPVTKNMMADKLPFPFVIDCTAYSDITDLYLIADILISDYSGVIFDFAILEKPIICFLYDYKDYIKSRGLYMDLRNELPGGDINEKELIKIIKNTPNDQDLEKVVSFKNRYITHYGFATELSLDAIFKNISESNSDGC